MPFHTITAYAIVVTAAAFLGWMSIRNQRSGWRRQRSHTGFDLLWAWAEANAEMRNGVELASRPKIAIDPLIGRQLSAMNAVLNASAGVSPVLQADRMVEREASPAGQFDSVTLG